jgi:sn-glycerol 3-phosphate transport system substrate-binding protein
MHARIVFRFSLFVLLILILAACPAPAAPPAAPPAADAPDAPAVPEETVGEAVTIQVFYPVAVDAPIANILQGYVDAFMAEHPNISVQPVFAGGYADVRTTIQTTVEGGGTPPALAVMLATDLFDLVNADLIISMDEYIEDEAWLDNFYPAFLANSTYDGQIWSIPFQRSVVALYYNADLLDEAGLSEPQSWADLSAAAGDLTEREGDQATRWGILYPSDWPYWLFQPLAIGAGQNIFDPEDDTTVYFDHPAVVQAIQFYIDLSAEFNAMPPGVQANWGQAPSAFAGGDAAMIVHSSGSLSGILNQADFEVGVMPIPGQDPGSFATVTGGGNLYIMNHVSEAQQQAAWQFIEFLTQPELVADFSIATGYIAAQPAAYETEAMQAYLEETPQAAELRDMLQHAGAELSLQNLGEVRNIFHRHLQAAFNREVSPADAMAAAQEEAERALAPFRE